jgi:hypothetical protein
LLVQVPVLSLQQFEIGSRMVIVHGDQV